MFPGYKLYDFNETYIKDSIVVPYGFTGVAFRNDDKTKFWYLNGNLHRIDGPAVEYANGDKEWFINNNEHRLDGPAVEWCDGTKQWWLDGKLHRLDGAAIEWSDGDKHWYIGGKRVTELQCKCLYDIMKLKGLV